MDSKINKKYNPCIVPTSLVKSCARALQSGLDKGYRPQSYLDGDIDVYKNALYRHLLSYLEGHLVDTESGLSVLDHIVANASILIELENQRPKEFNEGTCCDLTPLPELSKLFTCVLIKEVRGIGKHMVGQQMDCKCEDGIFYVLCEDEWHEVDPRNEIDI